MELNRYGSSIRALKCEDMIVDFQAWPNELLAYCQWEISSTLRKQFSDEAEQGSPIKQEDPTIHQHQVTLSGHKSKLQDKAVEYLNEYFSGALYEFGYQKCSMG
ncbi:hypothetical protein ACFL3A_00255 [Pseudomonadota bacterium]